MKQASFSTSSPLQHESTCQLLFFKKLHSRLVQPPQHQVFTVEKICLTWMRSHALTLGSG